MKIRLPATWTCFRRAQDLGSGVELREFLGAAALSGMAEDGPDAFALVHRLHGVVEVTVGIAQHGRIRAGRQIDPQDRQGAGIVEVDDVTRLHFLRQHFRGDVPARLGFRVVIGRHVGEQQHGGGAYQCKAQPGLEELQQCGGADAGQDGEGGGTPEDVARQQDRPPDRDDREHQRQEDEGDAEHGEHGGTPAERPGGGADGQHEHGFDQPDQHFRSRARA